MNQKKIGQFIATLRKNKNMTQRNIAEQLYVSEKNISKWECGYGLPEVTYMESLNRYDVENAGNLFYYFLAVCDFYGQYYQAYSRNRNIYLEQVQMSAKLLLWFERNITELNQKIDKWTAVHDPATMRREMYNKHLLERNRDGSCYWLEKVPQMEEFLAQYL